MNDWPCRTPAESRAFALLTSATIRRQYGGTPFPRRFRLRGGAVPGELQPVSRAERLLDLLQILRRHHRPVGGPALAAELGISIRTLYRDIVTLQGQGADIRGEPGVGYVLRPGFTLPPLMFSTDEIEALVLGTRWVATRGADAALERAALDALGKIAAVLPSDLRGSIDAATLLVARGGRLPTVVDPAAIRAAIRGERKLAISYRDGDMRETRRIIWPFLIGYFEEARMVAAWCELRQDYRHFRIDRIVSLEPGDERYPRRRADMARDWRIRENIPPL
jgi:predicted DNA-binding transcriptional regulator YafY